MRLSAKTQYGVRALFDIAFHGQGGSIQAKDIAVRQAIPLRYLEQIFQELRRAGLVESRRGPRGGYVLARAPELIRIGDVMRALQGPIEEQFVVEREPAGAAAHASLWRDLATKVARCFDELTVRDLCVRSQAQPMYFI
jgi:Rrf2 family protein